MDTSGNPADRLSTTEGNLTMRSTPEITDDNETVIEFTDAGPDTLGRRQFFAYWLDDNIGPSCDQHGVRGQVFYTNPDEFAARVAAKGRTVRYLTADVSPVTEGKTN